MLPRLGGAIRATLLLNDLRRAFVTEGSRPRTSPQREHTELQREPRPGPGRGPAQPGGQLPREPLDQPHAGAAGAFLRQAAPIIPEDGAQLAAPRRLQLQADGPAVAP